MDIFKQKRYLVLVIMLLVFLNLATLALLWLGRPQLPAPPKGPFRPEQEREQLEKLLQEELDFDQVQIKKYLILRQQHHQQVSLLENEIRQIKQQMFDGVLQHSPQPKLSDSLLALAQEKQARIEQLTFQHFIDLKELCKPNQQDKLKLLIHDLFRRKPAGEAAGPPPSPAGELPPRRLY